MADYYSSFEPKGTRWLLQRLTAAFLVVVLAFHFMLLHFVNHAADILVTATFHGVNGVYNALVNQGISGAPKTVVKYGLALGGVVLIAQGIRVALAMAGIL